MCLRDLVILLDHVLFLGSRDLSESRDLTGSRGQAGN